MPGRDHYSVLGVPSTASRRQIQVAFRRLARALHPDVNRHDPEAERQFQQVARAYHVLRDEPRRRAYDNRLTWGRFGRPGGAEHASYQVDEGPTYHSDLGHHSDFYQSGDPLTVQDAASLVGRHAAWLRRAIRDGRLRATRSGRRYLLRRRDVERLDRTSRRQGPAEAAEDGR